MTRVGTGRISIYAAFAGLLLCSACRGPLASPPTTPTSAESAPIITQVTPPFGLATGGTGIRIDGMWFKEGATLSIGGVPAVQMHVASNRVSATVAPHPLGRVDVVITNPDGRSARLAGGFTYVAMLPDDVPIRSGQTIASTLAGRTRECTFNDIPCRFFYVDAPATEMLELEVAPIPNDQVMGVFPSSAGTPREYPRRLTVAGGQRVAVMGSQVDFTLTARPQPGAGQAP